jgi:hypothetical protein
MNEIEILLRVLAKKMIHFLTPPHIREEILKFVKDIIHSRIIFDLGMAYDCHIKREDVVRELIDAVKQVYIGITVPENITLPPPEDIGSKKIAFEVTMLLLKSIQEAAKHMPKP